MKHPDFFLLTSSLFLAASAAASVPHRWTVETSRISPEQIEAYRGETLALEATLNAYGKPLETALESPVCLYWQTNGMGAVYWVTNAEVKTSIGEVRGDLAPSVQTNQLLTASFLPSFAPAASAVQGFIGSPSSSYRASFVIRFRNAPGETPNVLPLPAQAIDFSTITVYNPPYYTKDEVDEKVANATPSDYESVKKKANSALQSESDPTVPSWAKAETKPTYSASEVGTYTTAEIDSKISAATPSDYETVKSNASTALSTANANTKTLDTKANTSDLANVATSGSYSDLSNKPTIPTVPTKVSAFSNDSGYITQTTADSSYYPKASGDAWSAYWDGDDVRVTITNFDSTAHLPTLYLEQRTNDTASASSDTNAFRVVWREMTHWDAFLGSTWNWEDATWQGFDEWRASLSSALDEKADRAWGFYDSHTGSYAPDGYTSISSSNVMICAGASYQKTATATCDVWVLTANEPYEPTGVSANGGFQIKDADGNVQFEIVKGDKRTVKAQSSGVTVDTSTTPQTLVVTYNIVADEAPTGEVCLELANAQWKAETDSDCPATVTWSGSSGAWVARITPTASTARCFFKASYAVGGDTYVNNRCAVGMSQLVLGGVTYNLGTATIDGHTVLTLTPAN